MEANLHTLVRLARETSPYFRNLYDGLPQDLSFADLPLIDHTSYWAASTEDRRLVMTSPQMDGVVMKTGGYSQVELQRTTILLANGLLAGGVRAGDRIANMFYAGELYGSFLLHVLSIMALPVPVVHLPVGGLTSVPEAVNLVEQCDATVLLTTATSLVKMACHIVSTRHSNSSVRLVLFAGEPLFPEQKAIIEMAFPQASVRSCIYGTIDTGVLARAAPGEDTRVHQAFQEAVILEIFQDDGRGALIEKPGVPGMLVATNTVRQLCPVLRYPTGDRAEWVDREQGIFRLLGRAGHSVRLGPVSIDMVDIRSMILQCMPADAKVQGVQAVLTRKEGLDQLTCVIATAIAPADASVIAAKITSALRLQKPMLDQHISLGLVASIAIKIVAIGDLELTRGSAKLIDIVEKRF